MYRIVSRATATLFAGGAGSGAYLYETDDGAKRSIQAYSCFCPVILHYRLVELKDKLVSAVPEEEWAELDERYAKPTVARLGELQGMYAKYGQTAAGLTNTLGDAWVRELRTLENEIPPRSVDTVRKTIEEETNQKMEDLFSEFDSEPLGSASIGQVHRAVLKKNGQEVAVKVQYPEAGELFTGDIHAIRKLCEWFSPEQVCTLDALEKQNISELDYMNEANNLLEVSRNMAHHGFQPKEVLVPQPIPELSTKRMLVMDLLPGPKLIDGMRAYYAEWAEANGTTLKRMETQARQKIEEEGIPDKYDGPTANQIAIYQRWVRIQSTLHNIGIAVYNAFLPRLKNSNIEDGNVAYTQATTPPNTPRIVDTLMRVHGYQLLIDGLFNADPHGGNFLLLPDGRLGLIDYGSTKRLSENERINACVMYAALARNDKAMIWQMAKLGGYKSRHMNQDVNFLLTKFGFDSWGKEVTGGKNVQQFMDDLKRRDPWSETPDNFVLASFMAIRIRALTLGMNHPVTCSDWWGEIAEKELQRMGLPYESWDEEQLMKYRPELNIQKFDM